MGLGTQGILHKSLGGHTWMAYNRTNDCDGAVS